MGKPTLGLPATGKVVPPAEPPAKAPVPYLGAPVIVLTSMKIGGQNEHAALVTRVHSDDVVNVMVFPAEGDAYPISSISKSSAEGSLSWRWPSRN